MDKASILIVEDERIVAADMREILEINGYSVVGIEDSGENAIIRAGLLHPDLILMDIMLNGPVNGIQAAFRINETNNIPVIYVTANADNATFRQALSNNPFGYIKKPFRQRDLQTSVALALKGKLSQANNLITRPAEAAPASDSSPFGSILAQYNTSLYTLFAQLKEGAIEHRMLNLLIKICFKLAVFKVRKNFSRVLNINRRWELSAEDIAVESIASLFINNDKQGMLNIRHMLIKWNENVETEMDALFFLNKAVGLGVDQQMKKMLRDSDPFLAKEIDTVIYAINTYGYKKMERFGINYIVPDSTSEITGKTIGIEEFQNLPIDYSMKKIEIIESMMEYLVSETTYSPAIPLNAFAERMLCCRQSEHDAALIECSSHFGRISTDNIVECALRKTMQKLKSSYLDKGKISPAQYSVLFKSLKDIAFDLKEGNSIWNLSDYIKVHKDSITQKEYSSDYQNVLEYMVKVFKRSIADIM